MTPTLRLRSTVLPGNRVEFTAPELAEGTEVEIYVARVAMELTGLPPAATHRGVADYLASLPPVRRSAAEWAQIEEEFQRERDAGDR